jgi:hypothetical protein
VQLIEKSIAKVHSDKNCNIAHEGERGKKKLVGSVEQQQPNGIATRPCVSLT